MLEDVNAYSPVPIVQRTLFVREKPSGRVDALRKGNDFEVKSRGAAVHAAPLAGRRRLLEGGSGHGQRQGRTRCDREARRCHDAHPRVRDQDRKMLYGAEIRIVVP